jgi:hypothetical protein
LLAVRDDPGSESLFPSADGIADIFVPSRIWAEQRLGRLNPAEPGRVDAETTRNELLARLERGQPEGGYAEGSLRAALTALVGESGRPPEERRLGLDLLARLEAGWSDSGKLTGESLRAWVTRPVANERSAPLARLTDEAISGFAVGASLALERGEALIPLLADAGESMLAVRITASGERLNSSETESARPDAGWTLRLAELGQDATERWARPTSFPPTWAVKSAGGLLLAGGDRLECRSERDGSPFWSVTIPVVRNLAAPGAEADPDPGSESADEELRKIREQQERFFPRRRAMGIDAVIRNQPGIEVDRLPNGFQVRIGSDSRSSRPASTPRKPATASLNGSSSFLKTESVVIRNGPGAIAGIDLSSGRLLWARGGTDLPGGAMLAVGNLVSVRTARSILTIDPGTGRLVSTFEMKVDSSPGEWRLCGSSIAVLTDVDRLSLLDPASGKASWHLAIPRPNQMNHRILGADDRAIRVLLDGYQFASFKTIDGGELGSRRISERPTSRASGTVVLAGDRLLTVESARLTCFDVETGKRLWNVPLPSDGAWQTAIAGRVAVAFQQRSTGSWAGVWSLEDGRPVQLLAAASVGPGAAMVTGNHGALAGGLGGVQRFLPLNRGNPGNPAGPGGSEKRN